MYEQATTSTMWLAKANIVLLLGLMKFATALNDYITPRFKGKFLVISPTLTQAKKPLTTKKNAMSSIRKIFKVL